MCDTFALVEMLRQEVDKDIRECAISRIYSGRDVETQASAKIGWVPEP
jgi:hypothetical protein